MRTRYNGHWGGCFTRYKERAMTTAESKARDETQIRQLIEHWGKALHAKDLNALMSYYAPDILAFDIVPPLQCQGIDVYRKNFEVWFAAV
jgi:ketosteroid isomerase-like protein